MLNLFDVLLLRKFGGGSGGGSSITVEPLRQTFHVQPLSSARMRRRMLIKG